MLKNLMLVSMLTLISASSFAEEFVYSVGQGDLIISNDSDVSISIDNHLLGDNGIDLGVWQEFPKTILSKQTFKISLVDNMPIDAIKLVIESDKIGLSGFVFNSKEGEFYDVPGGIKQDPPKKGMKLIVPPKDLIPRGYGNAHN